MAYSDYGAFVYRNGIRQMEFEDCDCNYGTGITHGLIADGPFEIVCYKQGLPAIYKNGKQIEYYDIEKIDPYWFEPFGFKTDGYDFFFENCDKPYRVVMITPSGDEWECEYDYAYGAGFED